MKVVIVKKEVTYIITTLEFITLLNQSRSGGNSGNEKAKHHTDTIMKNLSKILKTVDELQNDIEDFSIKKSKVSAGYNTWRDNISYEIIIKFSDQELKINLEGWFY